MLLYLLWNYVDLFVSFSTIKLPWGSPHGPLKKKKKKKKKRIAICRLQRVKCKNTLSTFTNHWCLYTKYCITEWLTECKHKWQLWLKTKPFMTEIQSTAMWKFMIKGRTMCFYHEFPYVTFYDHRAPFKTWKELSQTAAGWNWPSF